MNDHIGKPFEPERLFRALLCWLPLPPAAGLLPQVAALARAPAPGPNLPLLVRLAGLPGLDAHLALRLAAGQDALLARVLASFASAYRAGEPALLEPPTPDGRRHWQAAAHSLRGACATVGAVGLQQRLADFEHALQQQGEAGQAGAAGDAGALAANAASLHQATIDLAQGLQALLDH